ncbi:MAG: hypothetical protein JWR09_3698 [Mucilaginibacter sp.]|nr:hypothetical protein [Mucilaginibacter sp.]
MENINYDTKLFTDESPFKAQSEFKGWIDSSLKYNVEIISSNMFYAPFYDDPTKYNFIIYVFYKYTL